MDYEQMFSAMKALGEASVTMRKPKDWYVQLEKPRTGNLYLRAGWEIVGETIGYTCKRVAGKSSDSWNGKRVWNTTNLRPKLVLCYNLNKQKYSQKKVVENIHHGLFY